MPVGTDPLTCFQREDVSWTFTLVDDNVSTISGFTITLVIKQLPESLDPPLLGPITATIVSAPQGKFNFVGNINLVPGVYTYSIRRTNPGFSWQLAQGVLTVNDSATID